MSSLVEWEIQCENSAAASVWLWFYCSIDGRSAAGAGLDEHLNFMSFESNSVQSLRERCNQSDSVFGTEPGV